MNENIFFYSGGAGTNLVVYTIDQDIPAAGSEWENRADGASASSSWFAWHKQGRIG